MIPNGILILNSKRKEVAYANKEMMKILEAQDKETYLDLSQKMSQFLLTNAQG